ncbi:uncharacterized protein LOC127869264 isoform X3 [Dreissena polymorpha]|uniref:uncharacterized protein LOC127869264 isoform X3 n=1 Tax=Dreissena polymorpha TaxID=45954 RepID=UPI002263E665|nr:uncharacterized protein LOC127869264 isoform X3 [Dreissena polymorpha]
MSPYCALCFAVLSCLFYVDFTGCEAIELTGNVTDVMENDTIVLTCNVSSAVQIPSLYWDKTDNVSGVNNIYFVKLPECYDLKPPPEYMSCSCISNSVVSCVILSVTLDLDDNVFQCRYMRNNTRIESNELKIKFQAPPAPTTTTTTTAPPAPTTTTTTTAPPAPTTTTTTTAPPAPTTTTTTTATSPLTTLTSTDISTVESSSCPVCGSRVTIFISITVMMLMYFDWRY